MLTKVKRAKRGLLGIHTMDFVGIAYFTRTGFTLVQF